MSGDHGHSCGCGCGGHGGPSGPATRDWKAAPDSEIVCHCHGLTKGDILAAIEQGAFTLPLVKTMTGAGRGGDCKAKHPAGVSCEVDIDHLLGIYATPPAGHTGGGCGC